MDTSGCIDIASSENPVFRKRNSEGKSASIDKTPLASSVCQKSKLKRRGNPLMCTHIENVRCPEKCGLIIAASILVSAGRIYSLCAASSVLVITTLENIDLYPHAVQALESERIERQRLQLRTVQLNEAVVATRHIAADARPLVLDDLGSIPLPDTRNTTDRIRR
jgi:hypothetical protein